MLDIEERHLRALSRKRFDNGFAYATRSTVTTIERPHKLGYTANPSVSTGAFLQRAASDKVNQLQAVIVLKSDRAPVATRHNLAVPFDGHAIGLQSEFRDQTS